MIENTTATMRAKMNEPESLDFINKTIAESPDITKSKLVRLLCEKYSFIAPNGEPQLSGFSVVLNNLINQGKVVFSKYAKKKGIKFTPMVISDTVYPVPENMAESVGDIKDQIEVIFVENGDKNLKQVWNDLIGKEHPQGNSKLVGYQVKYIIKYQDFYIGAAAFSSSAFYLEARDTWMQWTKEQMNQFRNHVICMSRFLIRNAIHCKNLASFLLSKLTARIKVDFKNRYNISPWLIESFVDTDHFTGTSYKAANWEMIGESKGRGRNDTEHDNAKSKKDLYIYVLEKSFRTLGNFKEKEKEIYLPLDVETKLSSNEWAEHEFRGIELGDTRLVDRVIKIATHKSQDPSASYAKSSSGAHNAIGQYYKFCKNESEEVSAINILAQHKKNTIRRMLNYDQILACQDTSDLNYNSLKATKGLGLIGKNKGSEGTLGLSMHARLAFTIDGLPLGILGAPCSAPEVHKEIDRHRSEIPIEEKETHKWLLGYKDDIEIAKYLPDTSQLITVCDRECDIFEVIALADENRQKNPIVLRSKHNRALNTKGLKLHDFIKTQIANVKVKVQIPPQRSRVDSSTKDARPYVKAREAILDISYAKVLVPRTKNNPFTKDVKPVEMSILYIREENPPAGSDRVEWILLTTLNIENNDDAIKCLKIYKTRWRIEEFFRVCKSCCKIEDHKLSDAKRLERVIAISLVIAWRIMLLTQLGRDCPNLPAQCAFSEEELIILSQDSKKKILTASEAIIAVAKLGGYQNRKNDLPPGNQIIGAGLQKLYTMVYAINLMKELQHPDRQNQSHPHPTTPQNAYLLN